MNTTCGRRPSTSSSAIQSASSSKPGRYPSVIDSLAARFSYAMTFSLPAESCSSRTTWLCPVSTDASLLTYM